MKKILLLIPLLIVSISAFAGERGSLSSRVRNSNRNNSTAVKVNKSDSIYESVRRLYSEGKISADSVVGMALYHKVWSPEAAERCLSLVSGEGNTRAALELGVLYTFSPEFSNKVPEGLKLLQSAAKAGNDDANAYLGFYYFNKRDYKKAKTYFDACRTLKNGFGYTALGSMSLEGKGVPEDPVKAREYYHQGALQGYVRGMTLYGFNLRATAGGPVSYPDAFFWLYMAGDLGDDTARTVLFLPRKNKNQADTEVGRDAEQARQWIELVQSGRSLKNDPLYKDGFLPSLKAREKAAEQGDDWARFYLGSMNYNGDFLNQNYARAIYYYEPIARNAKLPRSVLALVNERLAQMYREGKGTRADKAKAERYARQAARNGSVNAYRLVEKVTD